MICLAPEVTSFNPPTDTLSLRVRERAPEYGTPSPDAPVPPPFDDCDALENLEEEIVITVDLPCVRDKEDLEINCTGTSLEIEARMCHPVSFRKWGTVQREADFECFRKRIPLPAEVEPEGAKASLKGGILTVRLPKKRGRHRIRIL